MKNASNLDNQNLDFRDRTFKQDGYFLALAFRVSYLLYQIQKFAAQANIIDKLPVSRLITVHPILIEPDSNL